MQGISKGSELPKSSLLVIQKQGKEWVQKTVESDQLFHDRVVLIGLEGAFTPQCSSKHVPEYIEKENELKQKGVKRIVILSVNDPYVLIEFAKQLGGDESIIFIADGNGDFTQKLNMQYDCSQKCEGNRSKRFSAIVENNKLKELNDEKDTNLTNLSRVNTILQQLASY